MPNKNYEKGVRKERSIVNTARAQGSIAFRSAGSHSPIDVCIINKEQKEIYFIQCKPDDYAKSKTKLLEDTYNFLNDEFIVKFMVL